MAEADPKVAKVFLGELDLCMQRGRFAEEFFSILTKEDALRQKFLGYGTALDGAVVEHIRRGVVNSIAKFWLQDSNCCTPDWLRTFVPYPHGAEKLMQYLDQMIPIKIEGREKECDFLGLVELFKDESAVAQRLQEIQLGRVGISVGLFINPENPLDSSKTQTFRNTIGLILWDMIWKPRFATKKYSQETETAIQQELLRDVDEIFFPMFDSDQSNSIDVMEMVMGLIRVFRSFHSYENHSLNMDLTDVKRTCLSPLFNNLCRSTRLSTLDIFIGMFKRMQEWGTLIPFLHSLLTSDYLWLQIVSREFFSSATVLKVQTCCIPVDPSQIELYNQYCDETIKQLSQELDRKLEPFKNIESSKLAFYINDDGVHGFKPAFFEAKLESPPSSNNDRDLLFLFLWKFMDHFLSKSTSLRHFFSDYHAPEVEDIKAVKIEQLFTDLDRTKADTRVLYDAISLKRWFLYAVVNQCFIEAFTNNPELKNFYDTFFDGAPIEQYERLLFQVDRGNEMADFKDDQKHAEIAHFSLMLYDSDYPTFGRSFGVYPGFSFGLNIFEHLMKRYFHDNTRNLESPTFKRSCEVWFRCFGGNKSIPRDLHDDPCGHQRMHLNFKRMLLGLKKARHYLLTGTAEHSFALAFELIDVDGNQVLDYMEIAHWFRSWILYDMWQHGDDPGAVLEFYFKSGKFHQTMETLPADFRDHLVKFQREGRFFSSSEPHFKEFLAYYQDNWNVIVHDLANYICTELLNIATAYEFDHSRLIKQTISRQDMMCLLLDAPETNRFVHRLRTTEQGTRNFFRVVCLDDGLAKKGFGFMLSLQHLFKRWLALHGMWQPIPPSNAESTLVQSDFNSEKAQVMESLSHLHPIVIQNFSAIFDKLRDWIPSLPNSSCDKDNFRLVMNGLMTMVPQLCPIFLDSKVESMFACFDVDGNGSLDAIEIMHGFRTLLSRNQSSIADLAFRFADSSTETNHGPFSGAQNQKLDEDEFKKLIRTVCRDEPYVLQVILNKICLQEHPYFVSSVTQISAQHIEQLRFHPPLTLVRDFANPIPNIQHHQTLVDSLFEDQAGSMLLMGICRAVFYLRKQKSPHIDQHDFRQMFENNQLFGWMLRFWLLRGFLSDDHPQYLRLSGYAPPRDIQFCDNIEASEASARKPYQHLAWYFAAFNSQVDELLAHLQSQYVEITGSPFGQINQSQFEKLISRIFTNLGIKDQIDLSHLFSLFDADKSGEISRKEIIDGFVQHFHRIETVFEKIVTHFERKMIQDQNMTNFCLKHKLSVAQFFQKLKDLFVTRSTSLSTEIDAIGFCALWKQVLIDLGIRSREDPRIDAEAIAMFHVADTSGNGQIDFAELLYFVSEQCVSLLEKSAQEHQKITDLMHKAARYQEKHGTPQVLGSHTTLQFLEYAWNCFQLLAGKQKQDPVHFECSKQEFSDLWDELKHQLGFGEEDPLMHIDKVYNHIDTDGSGTISATEMIDGLIRHFLPIAEKSRSQSRAPQRSVVPSVSSVRAQSRSQASSASKPIKRPSITPGSPINSKVNAADAKLLSRVREEPWCRLAEEEFESIEEDLIGTDDFHSIVARLFEKKRIPILSSSSLDFMFSTFDTNGDNELSKAEFLCGMWRILAFSDAAAASCDDHDDDEEEQGGQWEGDYLQYLRLAVVPVSENQMLNVDRLHQLFTQMLNLQISQQGEAWRPSGTLVNLFKRHQQILMGLSQMEDGPYEIDPEYQHLMKDIAQPGKTVDIDTMNEKISCCSFGLAFEMMFKACHMNVELDFARVCHTEHPVTHVMNFFFGEDCDSASTYLIRQAMRDYLSSENMLPANDRSLLLRLKNARSASRATLSVGPSHQRSSFQPSKVTDSRSPPIDPQVSPRFGALEKSPAPASKRPHIGYSALSQDVSKQRFHVKNNLPQPEEEEDDDEDDDGAGDEEEADEEEEGEDYDEDEEEEEDNN